MKTILFLLAFSLRLFSQPLSSRIANYDIDVRFDSAKNMLFGKEILHWVNKSPDVIGDLQFHLYMNGFRNSQSTFMKESRRRTEDEPMEKERWGYIEVKRLALSSGEDLTRLMQFIHPDDDNKKDKSVFRVPLPNPLQPGDSISVAIDFEEKLPEPPIARTGIKREFVFAGQWFPKIGVYIDGAWNCHQFHANSEFFADFGVYNVRMTVPEKDIVGATGLEVNLKNNGDGTSTHMFHAEDVHDFAWTMSPEYRVTTGREQDVDIKILMQPDHVNQAQRHLDAAKLSVRYFQNWYGDYPFPNLTVVDPRRGAREVGGMEYPTIITAGTSYFLPEGIRLVEVVTIHEFGHNYWYHLLASNEFEESWMDEGINTYTEIQIMHDVYGSGDFVNFLGIKMNDFQFQRSLYLSMPTTDQTVRKAWEYSPGAYGVNSYAKPGLILTTLHNYVGRAMMQKIMRAYVERWKFKHPKSQDFVDVVNDVTGKNFNWFFDQALYSNKKIDYSIGRVRSYEVREGEGVDYNITEEGNPSKGKGETKDTAKQNNPTLYESEVLVQRLGDFKFPVEIEVVFENGEKVRERWNGEDIWKKLHYTKSSMLKYATVDPDGKVALDINYTNNSNMLEPQELGTDKTAFKVMFFLQALFDQPDLMNMLSLLPSMF